MFADFGKPVKAFIRVLLHFIGWQAFVPGLPSCIEQKIIGIHNAPQFRPLLYLLFPFIMILWVNDVLCKVRINKVNRSVKRADHLRFRMRYRFGTGLVNSSLPQVILATVVPPRGHSQITGKGA